jgi:predicted transposase YdaD
MIYCPSTAACGWVTVERVGRKSLDALWRRRFNPGVEGESLQSPHDKLFKQAFGRTQSAATFFRSYLPASLVEAIEWDTLALAPGSFVDEALRHQESDLLYTVRWRGRSLFLYCLFEHQSKVEWWICLRLLKYMVLIWERQARGLAGGAQLAPIVPMVLYQGRAAWTPSRRFEDLLAMPPAVAELAQLQPRFEHLLVDLSVLGLEEIQGDMVVRMALQMMRAAGRGELGSWLDSSGRLFAELLQQQEPSGILEVFLRYLVAVDSDVNYGRLCQALDKAQAEELSQAVMSIAEELIQKGRQEGHQEGLTMGELIGSIRTLQDLLGLPLSEGRDLEQKGRPELEKLRQSLRVRLQSRRE